MAPTAAVLTPTQHASAEPHRELTYPEKLQEYLRNVEIHSKKQASSAASIQTSGPQGKVVPHTLVLDPADWTAESLKGKESEYTYQLTKADVDEILAAVEKIRARVPATEESVIQLKKEDYDLPNFGPKLVQLTKNVSQGRGFQLLTGFPVEQFKGDRFGLVVAYWGLALVLGEPQISQTDYNKEGETFGSLLNHITVGRFTSVRGNDFKKFGSVDKRRLEFHSDQGATDLIAMLGLNAAPKGGESKWVSAVAIHNELLRRGRKDLVEALSAEGVWKVPRKIDQASYSKNEDGAFTGFEDDPPFVYHNGYLSSHFASGNYQEIKLTPLQEEAVWTFAAIAEDPKFHISKVLRPGDIEIISNQVILHSRGDVHDGETPAEKRHLLRWWVAQPLENNRRGVIPTFAPRSNVRPEGGFAFKGLDKLRLPFHPYTRHDGEGQSEW